MSIFNHLLLLERIHQHISMHNTGSPKHFALLLNISERKLYRILEELRDRGAIIIYDNTAKTYYYKNAVEFKLNFKISTSST